MPPRKEVYHEKKEVGSTVRITYSFVDQPLFGKYNPCGVAHLPSQSRNAKVLLGTILAWGDLNLSSVRDLRSGDSVDLGFWIWMGADSDVLLAAIQVADLGDQSRTIESESLQNLL